MFCFWGAFTTNFALDKLQKNQDKQNHPPTYNKFPVYWHRQDFFRYEPPLMTILILLKQKYIRQNFVLS